jgi:hypothetical protein
MRTSIVSFSLYFAACGGSPSGGVPGTSSTTDSATSVPVGDCPMPDPLTGHYAISSSPTESHLYLLGAGADAWDAEIGELTLDDQSFPFQHIARKAGAFYLEAGGAVYTFDPTIVNELGHVPVALSEIYGPSFTAFGLDPQPMAAEGHTLYCFSGGEVFSQGVAEVGSYNDIEAISGDCEFVVGGPATAYLYGWSGTASRRIVVARNGGDDLELVDESPDIDRHIVGVHFGDSVELGDLAIDDQGVLGYVQSGVWTTLRSTRRCEDPSAMFYGMPISPNSME